MARRKLFWSLAGALPLLAVAAWGAPQLIAEATTAGDPQKSQPVKAAPYVCPLTGEELPCPKCCPLNQQGAQASAKASAKTTGKKFNCCAHPTCPPGCCPECPPNCCPSGKAKPAAKAAKAKGNPDCPPCEFCP